MVQKMPISSLIPVFEGLIKLDIFFYVFLTLQGFLIPEIQKCYGRIFFSFSLIIFFRILKQFEGVSGEKLLALDRKQLEEFCGKSEGARLDSQITIQRNISGVSQFVNIC